MFIDLLSAHIYFGDGLIDMSSSISAFDLRNAPAPVKSRMYFTAFAL